MSRELELQPLKKLKIKFNFNYFFLLLYGLTILCLPYRIQKELAYPIPVKEVTLQGRVISQKKDGEFIQFVIKEKETYLVTYQCASEEEKKQLSKIESQDIITVKGMTEPIAKSRNFNLFDYQKFMRSQKIRIKIEAEAIRLVQKSDTVYGNIVQLIERKIGDEGKSSAYLKTFLLGDHNDIRPEVWDSFTQNGISHLFAISGMHVSFLSAIFMKLGKQFFPKLKKIGYIIFLFLLFYASLTNFQPSINRATFFFLLCLLKEQGIIRISTIHLFLLMTCFFLWFNPFFLFHTGFCYSYTISFFLIVCQKKLNQKGYWKTLLQLSTIAFFASFPITMMTTYQINLCSIIWNLFFVPFVTFFLFPFSFITFFLPICNPIFEFGIFCLEKVSLLVQSIDFLMLPFSKPPPWLFFLYYLFVTLIFVYQKRTMILFLLFLCLGHYHTLFFLKDPVLYFIDVGQGDATLFVFPKGKSILVDTGGKLFYQKEDWQKKLTNTIAENTLLPFFRSIGLHQLDILILTHGDEDHMREASTLIEQFPVKQVYLNSGKDNALELETIALLNKKKIAYKRVNQAQFTFANTQFQFLNPGNLENENEDSLVLFTKINHKNIVLMGDAGRATEEEIIGLYNIPKVDILKLGHHGSRYSSGEYFLDQVKPRNVFISAGVNNRFNHPHQEVITRLNERKIPYYLTSRDGMIKVVLNKKISISTCLSGTLMH